MGKQYNKLIKRKRRVAYLARRKAALLTEKSNVSRKSSNATASKPATRKKTPTKVATKPASKVAKKEVAEKAKPDDVLGPEVAGEDLPAEKPEKTPEG